MSALLPAADWLAASALDLAVLLGLLLVADRAVGDRLGPRLRYWMWSLLLVRMLLPALPPDPLGWKSAPVPAATDLRPPAPSERQPLPMRSPVRERPAPRVALERSAEPDDATAAAPPRGRDPLPAATRLPASPDPAAAADADPAAAARGAGHPAAGAAGGARPAQDGAAFAELLPSLLAALWLAGAAALLLRLAVQELRFRAALRRDARRAPAEVQRLLDDARGRAGLRRPVTALLTDAVPAPAVYGVLRPRLLLPPAALARLDGAELRHVLGHEVAHLRAGDTLLCWLLAVARALHWYHPAAWLGLRRLRAAQEVLRDYQALGAQPGADPGGYAATVLKLGAPPPSRPQPAPLPAILEDGQDLKRRIQMIVDFPLPRRGATLLGTCLLAGIGWAGLTTAASMPGLADDATAAQDPQLKSVRVVRQDPEPAWKAELLAKLQKPVDVDADGVLLDEVLDAVRAQAGVNVVVDRDAAESMGPSDLHVRARSAAQVLDLVCGEDLDWGLAPGVVMVGWEHDDLHRHDIRFYGVEELVAGEDPEWNAEQLRELVQGLSWRYWETEYASIQYWNGLFVVQQTDRGHAELETVLNMLLNRGRRPAAATPEWRAQLDARLAEPVDVDIDDQDFTAAVRQLSERTGVPMYVHPDLADGALVKLKLEGLPLRDVLQWIARQTWAHVVVEDGMVRFASQPPTEVRMYDVSDLVKLQGEDPEFAADQLTELVVGGTGWAAWEVEDARIESWDGMFVVVQTAETHAAIARFLDALREAL